MNKSLVSHGQIIWALFVTRTKEFYRDRGALLWSMLLPVCIVAAIAFAFSGKEQVLFKIGVYQANNGITLNEPLLKQPYVEPVNYTNFEHWIYYWPQISRVNTGLMRHRPKDWRSKNCY